MRVLADQLEPSPLIDPSGCVEDVVGPQHYVPVPGPPGERQALGDQPLADAHAARGPLYQEQPQLRRLVARAHAEHAADWLAAQLGDPRRLAGVVAAGR